MNATDPLVQQVVVAAIASKTIEFLKQSKRFPLLAQHTVAANRFLSVMISLAASAGFIFAWSGSLEHGGVLTITVPSLTATIDFAYHAVFQYLAQETTYQNLIRQPKAEALVATGTVTTLTGRPAGTVDIKGITAEAGSDAARVAAGEPVESKP